VREREWREWNRKTEGVRETVRMRGEREIQKE
jgi:hypothetical protein